MDIASPDAGRKVISFIRFLHNGAERTAKGRSAWALNELIKAGIAGITSLENPAPRLAAYIAKLRKGGVNIETIHEAHGGAFAGRHARYVLRSPITVIETVEAA